MNEKEPSLIPTAGVKFIDQRKVIRAYGVICSRNNEPVHYKEVMRITGLARTQISGLNSFFVMLGLLKPVRKGYYLPTESAIAFIQNQPGEEDFSVIKASLEDSYLYRTVREYFQVHGRSSWDSLVEFLLVQANSKEPARASSAIEWLECSDLVQVSDDDGLIGLVRTG